MTFTMYRFPGENDWYGVDLSDNTLCRKRDGGRLTVVARFSSTSEAERFHDTLERIGTSAVVPRNRLRGLFG